MAGAQTALAPAAFSLDHFPKDQMSFTVGDIDMQPQVVTSVKIPIRNRMYGMNLLAKHLNSLVESKTIQDWHPGRWTDRNHCEIEIGFDSAEDAQFAETIRGEW